MKRNTLFWILAFIITIFSAVYQRVTGPTYPLKGKVNFEKKIINYKLERSHSTNYPYRISINVNDHDIIGNVYWKRYKTNDEWQVINMRNDNGSLVAEIPPQPAAGKIQYRVELFYDGKSILIPQEESIILRFKDEVPALILIPHIIFIFLSMVFSTRAGLEYFSKERDYKKLVFWTIAFLILGGFIFGPLVQYYAFGKLWTGFPFGFDLTDNKTLIALLGWLFAVYKMKKSGNYDKWILIAALIMFLVFLIPHSLLGSELDYSKIN